MLLKVTLSEVSYIMSGSYISPEPGEAFILIIGNSVVIIFYAN